MRLSAVLPVLLVAASAALAQPTQLMSVQLQSAAVREKASPFGPVTGNLSYGDRVLILESSGSWRQVKKAPGGELTGWIHVSALTEKHILLKPSGDAAVRATSDEVAIAGKGFTKEVESQYKSENPKLDFTPIDRMIKIVIPQADLQAFVESANAGNGGAK
jgi:hypothetical protein